MTTDAGASHKAEPCMCSEPCTVCGTLYFDDITLEERTDCEHQIPMPTWHEYLTDAQVAQMNVDTTHGTGDAVHGDVLRDSRVEGDTISDVDTDGTTST